jgi:hypothetical protein
MWKIQLYLYLIYNLCNFMAMCRARIGHAQTVAVQPMLTEGCLVQVKLCLGLKQGMGGAAELALPLAGSWMNGVGNHAGLG